MRVDRDEMSLHWGSVAIMLVIVPARRRASDDVLGAIQWTGDHLGLRVHSMRC